LVTRRKKEDAGVRLLESSEPTTGELRSELLESPGADLASNVPESLTITVDLPATVHAAPEHEVAVTLENTVISPAVVDGSSLGTTSIAIIQEPVFETESEPQAAIIPPLPGRANDGPAEARNADARNPDARNADTRHADTRHPDYTRRDRINGAVPLNPEPAAMLTAERLLTAKKRRRPAPEGAWPHFLYLLTLHLVNLGDSRRVRERKAVDARIAREFEGSTRFVPILTRKGGVGKTTITSLIGMAMADVREDRVIAVDANPDRGTLAERINKQTRSTVRDVVTRAASITGFTDFSTLVSRDETRLDILASDSDPLLSEAFDENDYNVVADLAARYYSIVLTDCGTGIVHSVMRATLQRADSVVIVSGGSVDEARLASETLTWLEANGYGDLVRNAVVALNTATQGTNLVKLEEIEDHFRSRVRAIVRIPYDPQLAAGSVINYRELQPLTRNAARELAALVVDGLPTSRGN
jgi:MinD-like ATPase involved in chromosome partitioning or flagellar assembly